jgi:RNA polymerase primary sigma factor
MRDYLHDIGKIPLLTAEQEVELSKRIEAGMYAGRLLTALRAGEAGSEERSRAFQTMATEMILAREKEKQQRAYYESPGVRQRFDADNAAERLEIAQGLERYVDGQLTTHSVEAFSAELEQLAANGAAAKEAFIQANLRLVVAVARRYKGQEDKGLGKLDIIQHGNLGLIRAVEKFDYQQGYKFSTYATWWIRQSITRAISDEARTIRMPVHLAEELGRIRRTSRQLENDLGRQPTQGEIAQQLGTDEARVRMVLEADQTLTSLDFEFGEAGAGQTTTKLVDLLGDDDAQPGPVEVATHTLMAEAFDDLFTYLDERTRRVVQMRHGLAGYPVMTLADIGKEYGVSRERIRQIDAKAMEILRKRATELGMREFLFD